MTFVPYPIKDTSIRYLPGVTSNEKLPSKSVVVPPIFVILSLLFKIILAKGSGSLKSPSITFPEIND